MGSPRGSRAASSCKRPIALQQWATAFPSKCTLAVTARCVPSRSRQLTNGTERSVRGTGKPRDERMLPSKSWHSGSVEELKSIRRSWSSSGRVARLSGVAWSFGTRSIRGNSIHPLLANSARAFLKFFSSLFIVLIFSARAFKCRVFSQCLSTSPTPSASAALLCLRTRSRANIGDIRGTRIVTRVFAAHRCIPPVPCLYSSTEWTGPQRPWQEGRGSSGSLRPRRP